MMNRLEALKILNRHRSDAVVLPVHSTEAEWPTVSSRPELDLYFAGVGPMGKVASLGLGVALAKPERKVVVLDGDGSLLMNLGSMMTIVNMSPKNYIHFLFENRVYERVACHRLPMVDKFSFAQLARLVGYARVYELETLEELEANIWQIMKDEGPVFVVLKVEIGRERYPIKPHDIVEMHRVMAALQNE